MKKSLYRRNSAVFALIAMIFACGCTKPKTIDDAELSVIFRDIYISNAYYKTYHRSAEAIDIYEPILDKYGYDIDDFHGTLLGFSKRKNSKLSDIIEKAIQQLEQEANVLKDKIAIIDTIKVRAQRQLEQTLIVNQHIVVESIKDTAKLRIVLDAQPGIYYITYIVDSDSANMDTKLRGTYTFLDSVGKNMSYGTDWFGGVAGRRRYTKEMTVIPGSKATTLVLNLANYAKNAKKAYLTIDSLSVKFRLAPEVAADSVKQLFLNKLLIDGKRWQKVAEDSGTLHIPTSGDTLQRGDNSK